MGHESITLNTPITRNATIPGVQVRKSSITFDANGNLDYIHFDVIIEGMIKTLKKSIAGNAKILHAEFASELNALVQAANDAGELN